MLSLLKNLFKNNSVDLSQLIKDGAIIVDVRSKAEFATGHVKGSINIPLEQIGTSVEKLKSHNHIITCCRSGN
ncbi:MAG: rhodanese-like domain-containing protein, partial [Bacteroidia bacterium]|nr:rhodanese-like domain-containing protein [Bacteroidia bacterium]